MTSTTERVGDDAEAAHHFAIQELSCPISSAHAFAKRDSSAD